VSGQRSGAMLAAISVLTHGDARVSLRLYRGGAIEEFPAVRPGAAPGLAGRRDEASRVPLKAEDVEVDRVTRPNPPAGAPASAPAPALTIDALGRKCPIPIIMLAERIREVPIGQVVAVLADDPAARTDVPAWCAIKSHEFVTMVDLPSGWAFVVKRCY